MNSTPKTTWDLEETLINLKSLSGDVPISIGQACEGIMVFGTSGSGKTSGAHDHILLAMMEKGYGLMGLCAKPEEGERLLKLAGKARRGDDVIHVRLGGEHRFNFLDYLKGGGAPAVVAAFEQISESLTGNSKKNEWTMAASQLLSNLVDLFLLAGKPLEMSQLRLASGDMEIQKALLPQAMANSSTDEEMHSLTMLSSYFSKEWANMGEKTRASVLMSLTPALNPFCAGPMHTLFCTESTFSPRDLRAGKIIIVDIPATGEQAVYGRAAGVVLKYMTQMAVESYFGNGKKSSDASTRPVCILADECQYYTVAKDAEFVTTSRSLRASLFFLTQDINNFWRRGGDTVKAETATLLSNIHGVRLLHQNEDKDTYEWFMAILGKEWKAKIGQSANFDSAVGMGHGGASLSMDYQNLLSQRDFQLGLARGGPKYKFLVTGILQQAGRAFNDKLFTQVAFQQFKL